MSVVERVVAALLLAGAVAGVVALPHLISEPVAATPLPEKAPAARVTTVVEAAPLPAPKPKPVRVSAPFAPPVFHRIVVHRPPPALQPRSKPAPAAVLPRIAPEPVVAPAAAPVEVAPTPTPAPPAAPPAPLPLVVPAPVDNGNGNDHGKALGHFKPGHGNH